MNKTLEVCRHDDFDFRMQPSQYIAIHEEFIKAGLVETAVLQFAQNGNISNYDPYLLNYMNTASNWDFQIHGWWHNHYDEMDFNYIVRDLAACIYFCEKFFNKKPTVWYPPWNRITPPMKRAAGVVGLKMDGESYDITKFIRDIETDSYNGHSFYFHGWKADEILQLPKAIELAKTVWKGVKDAEVHDIR